MARIENCLTACLESVFRQSLQPFEVIVVNDGSTDGTAAIAGAYRNKIRYFEKKNIDQGAARNTGLAKAGGNLIAFLDADDYWKPLFLEKCTFF